jgi:hypothetical protein
MILDSKSQLEVDSRFDLLKMFDINDGVAQVQAIVKQGDRFFGESIFSLDGWVLS